MGDNFKALFKVYDAKGNLISIEEARSEFAAIFEAVKKGLAGCTAECYRVINL